MDNSSREKYIERMEEVVLSLREQLAKNEGSILSNIGNSTKMGFESMKTSLSGDDHAKAMLDRFKDGMDEFEDAIKDGNRQIAGRALDKMERIIQDVKVTV